MLRIWSAVINVNNGFFDKKKIEISFNENHHFSILWLFYIHFDSGGESVIHFFLKIPKNFIRLFF